MPFSVQWGDGVETHYVGKARDDDGVLHSYSEDGVATVIILGAIKALDCRGNELTSLDVSNNIALESLHCGGNGFTTVDISKNTVLKELLLQ